MNRRQPSATLLLLCLALAAPAFAQQRRMSLSDDLRFRVLDESGTPAIPFEMINHHLVLPASVNGSGPFRIVLDTGMPGSSAVLYGSERVDALELEHDPSLQARVGGAGGGGHVLTAQIVRDQTLTLPGLEIAGMDLTLLPPLPGFATYHDGIIGAALFRNFAVEVDQDAGLVRLHDPETYRAPEDAAELPLEFRGRIPFASITVILEDGARVEVSVAVDLGASHPVSLNAGTAEGLRVPAGAIATEIGRGLSGEVHGKIGRVAAVELAGHRLENVVATFPDAEHHFPRGMDSRNGNLGNGIMSRFNVTFDYARERMLLVPSRRFPERFEHDMSGLILREEPGRGIWVKDVLPGSPADAAGLRADDVLLRVNGVDAGELGVHGLREVFRNDGARVTFVYRRGQETAELVLELRRLV